MLPRIAAGEATVRTDRLLLRPWREADRAAFAALNADAEVMEHFPGLMTREASDAFVDRIQQQWRDVGWGLWAVEVPGVAPFIGFVGLWRTEIIAGKPQIEVGWRLARPFWRQGYATEAALQALEFGFEVLKLDEIVSFTIPRNTRSSAVMERIGMHHDPVDDFDHPRVDPVQYPNIVRHVLYRLTRPEWQARHMQERRA